MVREANPPRVPPRPDMLRPRPRSPAPPLSSPPSNSAAILDAPPRPSQTPNSPPSIYSQKTSVAASPNLGNTQQTEPTKNESKNKALGKEVAVEKGPNRPSSGKQSAVKFSADTTGGSRSPSLGPTLFFLEKETKDDAVQQNNDKHERAESVTWNQTHRPAQIPNRKPIPSHRSTSESKGKEKERDNKEETATKPNEARQAVSLQKQKQESTKPTELARSTQTHSSKDRGGSLADTQSLIRSNHSSRSGTSTVQRLQQRQDIYRTHTRSAEARALYAEAKDHYGKAKNHLQEALRLSVDVFRLAPHVLVENVASREIRSKTTSGITTASLASGSKGARYVPEYPGLGIQYRSLFTPLLANVSNDEKDRKQALAKKRADDALTRERAVVARHAGVTSSVVGSARSGRSNITARSTPARAPTVTSAPAPASTTSTSVTSRATGHSDRQRTKRRSAPAVTSGPASVSTRTAARMRDNYERRPRTRTRSAANRRLRKSKEQEVDHGILWFFSY